MYTEKGYKIYSEIGMFLIDWLISGTIDILLVNQDVCLLLNISKRTLQRYRDNGLKYYTILHKTYYREKDLHEFIRRYFDGENVEKGKTKECNGDERIEGGMLSDDKDEPMEEDKPVDEGKLTEDA